MAHEQGKVCYLVHEFLMPFAAAAFALVVIGRLVFNSPVPYFVVPTNSMYPVIRPGDILFSEGWNLGSIRPGDIIVYRGYNAITHRWYWIVHRVREVKVINGSIYLITAGDYNVQLCKESGVNPVYCYDNGTLYPDQGLPLRKCPVFGSPSEFCVAGKVLALGGKPLKVPLLGELILRLRGNI